MTLVLMDKYYTQIDAWLQGELNDTQKRAFEQALRRDPELAEAVAAQQKMLLRLEGMRLRQKLDAALQETPPPTNGKPPFTRRLWMVYVLLLGSAALGIVYMLKKNGVREVSPRPYNTPVAQPPVDTPSAQPSLPPVAQVPKNKPLEDKKTPNRYLALAQTRYIAPASDLVRGKTDTAPINPALSAAKTAFTNQQYDRVARLLHNETQWGEETELMRLLRACSRFKIGHFNSAAQDFRYLENSFQYRQEARWHLMLCTLANGNVIEAQQMLDTMAQDTTYAYREQAIVLKEALR